jgi:hypothetical protein
MSENKHPGKPIEIAVVACHCSDEEILLRLRSVINNVSGIVIYRSREAAKRFNIVDTTERPNWINYVTFHDLNYVDGDPQNSLMHMTRLHSTDFSLNSLVLVRTVDALNEIQEVLNSLYQSTEEASVVPSCKATQDIFFASKYCDGQIDIEDMLLDDVPTWKDITRALVNAYGL